MALGQPLLDHVEIDSVSVDDYKAIFNNNSWEINDNRKEAMRVKSGIIYLSRAVESVLTMDGSLNGKLVTIQRGVASATEKYIFRGHVVNVRVTGNKYIVTIADKLASISKRKVTTSYDINIDSEVGKFSEIFKSLINDHTNLTADATSVQDSGTIRTLNKFICKGASVYERCATLMETIGWQAFYNPEDDLVYANPPGYVNQSTNIVEGTNIVKNPKWDMDSSQLFNKVEIRGAVQEVETTESGRIGTTTGYTTSNIQLTKEPKSVKVYADSSNPPTTLRIGGVENSTESYDYLVDPDLKQIIWSDTYTPAGTDYVEVLYSYLEPAPVVTDDEASIIAYSEDPLIPDPKEIVLHKNDITNVADAEIYANQYLDEHKDAIYHARIQVTNVSDIATGQRVYINNPTNDKVGYYYVISTKQSAPYSKDEIEVASVVINEAGYVWNVDQRVKRLEELEEGEEGILLHVKDYSKTIEYARYDFDTERYKICDSRIVGHYINGKIGMGTTLDDFNTKSASWLSNGLTDSDEASIKIEGAGSLKIIRSTGAGTGYIESSQAWGDISSYTGTGSGVPNKGTIGVWIYTTTPSNISAIDIRIGSGSIYYRAIQSTAYASVDGYDQWSNKTFSLQSGWNYILFHLTDGSNTGTPDWTWVDYCRISLTFTANTTAYIDYLTVSGSNYIGQNGVGVRRMTII